jgi:threonine/homoserine/homoserine lactone efflux protein
MSWHLYGTYLIFVVLVVLAPGPDTVVTLKNALSGGTRGGLAAASGITVATCCRAPPSQLGLGTVIVRSQPLFVTLGGGALPVIPRRAGAANRAAR